MRSKKRKENSLGFMDACQALGRERGITPEVLFDAVEAALISAYRRNFNSAQNVRVTLDRSTGRYQVFAIKTVVEEVADPVEEISLTQAQAVNHNYAVGDVIEVEVTPADFGRIAAQTAKQVVVQRIREAERGNIYDEFSNRAGDIVSGVVERTEARNVFVDLGKTEAILTPPEQIPGEVYHHNDHLKAYIIEVRRTVKGPQIILSRTHPGLLKRLFELEVPEIQEGLVEIKSVAREAGMRSKIAVYSTEPGVDPVGSSVGHKGLRVQSIVDELGEEKIDVVRWDPDPAKFIANALSPAKAISVIAHEDTKESRVIVPEHQLSLAIGKEGQNARLAAKLTGWKIDIKSEEQVAPLPEIEMDAKEVEKESALAQPLLGNA